MLPRAGLKLFMGFDQSIYINSSINMVRNNLMLGMGLAIVVLWWFLRRFKATLIVALSIPLCLFMSFLVMYVTGRTVNIISLAGLAFATGMVLDAAIVVLENIFRQREAGRDGEEGDHDGDEPADRAGDHRHDEGDRGPHDEVTERHRVAREGHAIGQIDAAHPDLAIIQAKGA